MNSIDETGGCVGQEKSLRRVKKFITMPRCIFLKDHKNGDTDTQHRNTGGGKTELRALKGKAYQF